MNITREDLRAIGIHIPPEGGLATRVGPELGRETPPPKREGPKPLPQFQIDAMVAAFPAPTRGTDPNNPEIMPRVLGCDPSLNEAGFAMVGGAFGTVGGAFGTVRTGEFRAKPKWSRQEKVLALADFAAEFAGGGFAPDVVIVEGVWYRNSSASSAESIQGYSEAVGATLGALRIACPKATILRVEPDWMPEVLMGQGFGPSAKEDRHGIAAGLFARAGLEWPGGSPHECDALAQAAAWLVREGWL